MFSYNFLYVVWKKMTEASGDANHVNEIYQLLCFFNSHYILQHKHIK
jgi:hypothetical protein